MSSTFVIKKNMERERYFQKLRDTLYLTKSMVQEKIMHLHEDELNKKSNTSTWSVGHCIEHINLYNRYYVQAIEQAILKAETKAPEVVLHSWLGKKSIESIHPSNLKKQKTFKKMDPAIKHERYTNLVVAYFMRSQDDLLKLINMAEMRNFNSKLVPIEFFRLLKLTIAESLEFILAHQQRHVNQAIRILTAINPKESILKV
jgi:uncharacterized damage-inducible protein DinB